MNFDLSKIYSEQVNKQKVYLNPYIPQRLDILEERASCGDKNAPGTSNEASQLVQDLLLKLYPNNFSAHGQCSRIFKNLEISIDQFKQNFILSLPDNSGDIITKVEIIDTINSYEKYKGVIISKDMDTVIFNVTYRKLEGGVKVRTAAMENTPIENLSELVTDATGKLFPTVTETASMGLAGKLETSFGTPVKENFPGLLFNLGETGYLQNDEEVYTFFNSVMVNGILKPESHGTIPGQAITQCNISLNAFKTRMDEAVLEGRQKVKLPSAQRGMLNGSLSIPQALADADFTPENFIYMAGADNLPNEPHGVLKSWGAKLSGKQTDEWCPADIFIVPRGIYESEGGFTNWLNRALGKAPPDGDDTARLLKLNSLFAKEFKASGVDHITPILALSLKQESGRGGKAKNYIRQRLLNPTPGNEEDALPPSCDVNMTPEEINPTQNNPDVNGANGTNRDFWVNGINAFLQRITQNVNSMSEYIKLDDSIPTFGFDVNDSDRLGNNKTSPDQYLFAKYGALKALDCILSAGGGAGIFVDILRAGRKIDDGAPSFFKMVESTKGHPAKVEPQYKLQVSINYPIIISQIYNPTYKGVEIILDTTENSGANYSKRKIWKIVMTTQKTNAQQIEIETAPGKTL